MTIADNAVLRLQGHLYAEAIGGLLANGDQIKNLFGFCGIKIFYDAAQSAAFRGTEIVYALGKTGRVFHRHRICLDLQLIRYLLKGERVNALLRK